MLKVCFLFKEEKEELNKVTNGFTDVFLPSAPSLQYFCQDLVSLAKHAVITAPSCVPL